MGDLLCEGRAAVSGWTPTPPANVDFSAINDTSGPLKTVRERLMAHATTPTCASCHTPVLLTDRHSNPVFDQKPVRLYSDLLLHDVGTGDGIPQW
jgi:CxxC motif-containing protein (DUF1111 family)